MESERCGRPSLDAELATVEHFIAQDDWDGMFTWYASLPIEPIPLPPDASGSHLLRLQQRLQHIVSLLQARQDEVSGRMRHLDQTQACALKLSRTYGGDGLLY